MQRPMWSNELDLLPSAQVVREHNYSKYLVAFVSRNCLDVFRSQNGILNVGGDSNLGWTCMFGRRDEWSRYQKRSELVASVDSMHDMICTIKQQAYLRFQMPKMQKLGIDTLAVDYNSFHLLGHFLANHSSLNHQGHAKDTFGFRRTRKLIGNTRSLL